MPKKYKGEGDGGNATEALQAAFDDAWHKAKHDGKQGKKLKVGEWHVKGDNPINWSSIVLIDEDDLNL
jgi:hypothetical protein